MLLAVAQVALGSEVAVGFKSGFDLLFVRWMITDTLGIDGSLSVRYAPERPFDEEIQGNWKTSLGVRAAWRVLQRDRVRLYGLAGAIRGEYVWSSPYGDEASVSWLVSASLSLELMLTETLAIEAAFGVDGHWDTNREEWLIQTFADDPLDGGLRIHLYL